MHLSINGITLITCGIRRLLHVQAPEIVPSATEVVPALLDLLGTPLMTKNIYNCAYDKTYKATNTRARKATSNKSFPNVETSPVHFPFFYSRIHKYSMSFIERKPHYTITYCNSARLLVTTRECYTHLFIFIRYLV